MAQLVKCFKNNQEDLSLGVSNSCYENEARA